MSLKKFLNDKLYLIIIFLVIYIVLLLMFLAFKIDKSLILVTSVILFVFIIVILSIEYFRRKDFYTNLLSNIEKLDKAYLVLETINKPNFYDGEILCQALYEVNKSMMEFINSIESQMNDFKEYIEMWIHEVKIPIASLVLMTHNNSSILDKKYEEQIKKLENYVEQVLYYARSENAEKDYLINEVSLNKIISNVALKNKDDLLENKIDLIVLNVEYKIYTDSKWLEFIINQIINNSIKYKRKIRNSYVKIDTHDYEDKIILTIEDNGIGIQPSDIRKVFDKTFTGKNGRIMTKSTGMGLFIAKNLCQKLGHKIEIESTENKYTKVSIIISKNRYYEVLK